MLYVLTANKSGRFCPKVMNKRGFLSQKSMVFNGLRSKYDLEGLERQTFAQIFAFLLPGLRYER